MCSIFCLQISHVTHEIECGERVCDFVFTLSLPLSKKNLNRGQISLFHTYSLSVSLILSSPTRPPPTCQTWHALSRRCVRSLLIHPLRLIYHHPHGTTTRSHLWARQLENLFPKCERCIKRPGGQGASTLLTQTAAMKKKNKTMNRNRESPFLNKILKTRDSIPDEERKEGSTTGLEGARQRRGHLPGEDREWQLCKRSGTTRRHQSC